MTVPDLSFATRIQERTIRRWLAGETEPGLTDVRLLSQALKVSADYLVGNIDEPTPLRASRQ